METDQKAARLGLLVMLLTWADNTVGQMVASSNGGLVASIQSGGLQGSVEFVPDVQGTYIRVFLRGGTYGEKFRWKIHEFPAIPGAAQPCSEEKIGRTFVDLTAAHGVLIAGQDANLLSTTKLINGNASVLGRTLVLRSPETNRLSCAIIQPTSRIRTFLARFSTPVGGTVLVRQSTFGTSILAQLWYTNGTRRDSVHQYAILQSTTSTIETPGIVYQHELSRCSSLQALPFLPASSDREGPTILLAVGRAPGTVTGRTYHTLSSAPVLDSSQSNLYVALYATEGSTEILACAKLTPVEPRQAVAKFESEIAGEISFRQESPFDPTLVTVNLVNLDHKVYSYGIDELPVIVRGDKTEVCPNVRGVIYNPLRIVPDSVPEPSKGSFDQYAVGDLSGKYGPLRSKDKHFQQIYDLQLSLFGVHSVVGRAAVLYSPSGNPLACANVELSGRRLVTAFATFDFPLQGQVILRQDRDDPTADTSVYVELSYPARVANEETRHHQWHVHERAIPTGQRFSLSGPDCFQAGGHFNPYNVSVGVSYECECSGLAPERCEIGDCSGKLGFLNIPPFGVTNGKQMIARYFFTDPALPLVGPTSVVGRAVVIHGPEFTTDRLACANIFEHFSDYGK